MQLMNETFRYDVINNETRLYIKKKFIHFMGIYNFEGISRLFNFFHIIEPRRLKN